MTQTTARAKKTGKTFEILVDMERALKYKKGEIAVVDFLAADFIFSDIKQGEKASEKDLVKAFGTEDVYEIAGKIVKDGEILLTQDYRDAEKDRKEKQVIDFLVTNSIDPRTGNPHTPDRIKNALEQAHMNIKNMPIESQISEIMAVISPILPIKIEIKKLKINIPAIHTGKAYGLVNTYKESEEWLSNGDLEIILNIPAGLIMSFYDKLNSVTHGSALVEEIKQK
ncbi:MAG: ribosome assembly factor SBDS [Nanoarchaeota archaeon]